MLFLKLLFFFFLTSFTIFHYPGVTLYNNQSETECIYSTNFCFISYNVIGDDPYKYNTGTVLRQAPKSLLLSTIK